MEYAEWLEMEREILARDRAAFVGERPLAGWEIDGRKAAIARAKQVIPVKYVYVQAIPVKYVYVWQENARETH